MKNEDQATTAIEYETRKLPSLMFLGAAFGAMAASGLLILFGKRHLGLFIGQWVAPILVMGTYNKLAKTFSPPYSDEERQRHGNHPAPGKRVQVGAAPVPARH